MGVLERGPVAPGILPLVWVLGDIQPEALLAVAVVAVALHSINGQDQRLATAEALVQE